MKPMQVEPGQHAPDVDELVEKAGSMIEKLQMDNSQIRNITGVEEAPMNHYYTNQQLPESPPEDITNKGASSENVSFIDANPHQSGSTLASHENPSGGDAHPPSSYTHSSVGKPPSDVRKNIEIILKKRCPNCGGDHMDKNVSCSVKKAGPPMPLPPEGGGPQPPPEGGGGDDPLAALMDAQGGGDEDVPDDPMELSMKIKDLVDKLADKAGGGGEGPQLEGGGPDEDAPPGAGPPSPMGL
jgi:hypothetical protein